MSDMIVVRRAFGTDFPPFLHGLLSGGATPKDILNARSAGMIARDLLLREGRYLGSGPEGIRFATWTGDAFLSAAGRLRYPESGPAGGHDIFVPLRLIET